MAACLLLVFIAVSCFTPKTKQAYLENFENFIERVKVNYRNYKEVDWRWADERFKKFSKEWYHHFREELTAGEKIKVAEWVVEYESFKGSNKIRDAVKKFLNEDVVDAKNEIEEYVEKDLGEDIDKMIEGAKEIGDSALKVIDDVARELKKNH